MRTCTHTETTNLRDALFRKWMAGLTFFVLFGILVPCAMAQTLRSVPVSRLTDLTPHPGFFNEPSIAVNPNSPQQIVAAYQVNATAAFSADAGEHWALASGTAPKNYVLSGDVSVTFDGKGHAFLCYIAFDKPGTENYWAHNATRNGIFVRRSNDGGKTWNGEASTVISHSTRSGIPFEDKPYIVADTNPKARMPAISMSVGRNSLSINR